MLPYTHDLGQGIHVVTKLPSEKYVCEQSLIDNGVFRINRYAVSRVIGNKEVHYWLVDSELDSIELARKRTQSLIGINSGYTYPRMARDIIKWLDISQRPFRAVNDLVPKSWHYQLCTAYKSEWAWLYDITSAYWQVAARAPSPVFSIIDSKLEFATLPRDNRARWSKLCDYMTDGECKRLRLALIGVNAAGWNAGLHDAVSGCVAYCGGRRIESTPPPTALQPLALLAVRCTYEITQIQATLVDAIYANADCVITESLDDMTYWDYCNIQYSLKAQGPCQINHIGAWEVGDLATKLFSRDNPMLLNTEPEPLNDLRWHRQLLGIK